MEYQVWRLLRNSGGGPREIVMDKLRSYGVAHRELIPEAIHDASRYAPLAWFC